MGMNQLLDEFYGTSKTASATPSAEVEKTAAAAEVQLFLKLAADNNIDVNGMLQSADGKSQVDQLWMNFQKHAAAAREHESVKTASAAEQNPLIDQAEREHSEKKEAATKIAHADFCGRVMAHAMVQEMRLIEGSGEINKEAQAVALQKAAEFPPKKDEDGGDKDDKKDDKGPPKDKDDGDKKEAGVADRLKGLGSAAKDKAKHLGKQYVAGMKGEGIKSNFSRMHHERGASIHGELAAKERLHGAVKRTGAAYGATAAAAGGAGAAANHAGKKKESSAIDMLAAELAVEKVAQYVASFEGATQEQVEAAAVEVAEKLAAADVLGLFEDSTKIASAADLPTAIDWRACELLETVGYPVVWAD